MSSVSSSPLCTGVILARRFVQQQMHTDPDQLYNYVWNNGAVSVLSNHLNRLQVNHRKLKMNAYDVASFQTSTEIRGTPCALVFFGADRLVSFPHAHITVRVRAGDMILVPDGVESIVIAPPPNAFSVCMIWKRVMVGK